jgi:hypothetical protein
MIKPPKTLKLPKKPRLEKRKRMTIALGIMAQDGLVVGADSEESTGFLKSTQQKLMPLFLGMQIGGNNAHPPTGVCVFTGSGDGGYIDAVTEDLMEVMYDESLHGHMLKKALGKRLKEFYKDHIIPFAAFPEDDRPSMDLLIAVQKFSHELYVTDRTTIRSARPYGVVGIGGTFAKNMLDGLWRIAPAKQIATLAVYVLAMVKENVEHCGKFSSVMILHNWVMQDNPNAPGSMLVPPPQIVTRLSGQEILDLEMAFANDHAKRERDLFWEFVASHS